MAFPLGHLRAKAQAIVFLVGHGNRRARIRIAGIDDLFLDVPERGEVFEIGPGRTGKQHGPPAVVDTRSIPNLVVRRQLQHLDYRIRFERRSPVRVDALEVGQLQLIRRLEVQRFDEIRGIHRREIDHGHTVTSNTTSPSS
nr:hypothetical protein [Burkholderia gladioli]